jgi:two-component system OmpR family response regulator
MRILVIEDDREAAQYLAKGLRESGHTVDLAADGEEGLALARDGAYDVLVVDRMLPKRDGLSVVMELRQSANPTPVLFLSALGEVDDRVKGLRAGGDDYLAKPYAFSELVARVDALGRRRGAAEVETVLTVGDLELDRLAHRVQRGGTTIPVQPREFRLLECRSGRDPHHAARKCLGLSFRSADQRHRRTHVAASLQDRQGLFRPAAAHRARRRLHDPRRRALRAPRLRYGAFRCFKGLPCSKP